MRFAFYRRVPIFLLPYLQKSEAIFAATKQNSDTAKLFYGCHKKKKLLIVLVFFLEKLFNPRRLMTLRHQFNDDSSNSAENIPAFPTIKHIMYVAHFESMSNSSLFMCTFPFKHANNRD